MRKFLPIKGPGGRYLTPREKVALLVLGLTLVLCILTVVAGENAYDSGAARNPVFGIVATLCRTLGGGIVALYGLVLIWSGLIYFKGEKIANIAPFGGRIFAALAVTVGVSGALGIAQLSTAGSLGSLVGHALGHTFGPGIGFPILLLLMMLGIHLAGQGTWTALREPIPVGVGVAPRARVGFGADDLPERRFQGHPSFPDDGDPSADERTLAVTQAMEEIERSKGVTIVDLEPEAEAEPEAEPEPEPDRASIGEEVDEAPAPPPDSEEASVRQGLMEVAAALETRAMDEEAEVGEEEHAVAEPAPEEDEAPPNHGFVPVPPTVEEDDLEPETEVLEVQPAVETVREEPLVEEYGPDEPVFRVRVQLAPEEPASFEIVEETVEAEAPPEEEVADQADGFVEDEDPFARGGLLKRMQQAPAEEGAEGERPFTSFDWRGRPLG